MSNTLAPRWLSAPETAALIRAFEAANAPLRFVGGCVRDAKLGKEADDIDAATPLVPDRVMALLQAAGIKAIPTGIDHGTITAVIGERTFEITTLRRDTSCDGRHAAVEYTTDWQEDARRRDFTINAFYLSSNGELFDYFNGAADLAQGYVRFIGNPDDRIQEDYLRILRFFRFYAWYGRTEPDIKALAACSTFAKKLDTLSGERVQQEMFKLLSTPLPVLSLQAMRQAGVLEQVLGVAAPLAPLARLIDWEQEPQPIVRLAALLMAMPEKAETIVAQWRLSNADARRLQMLLTEAGCMKLDVAEAELKKNLRRLGAETFLQAARLRAAADESEVPTLVETLATSWTPPEFPLSGDDLKAHGLAEGRALGDALRRLEEAWEASNYTLTRDALLKQL